MQNYLSKRSRERGSSGGEFFEVISTLTRDLTKARNQLVRLMDQVSPGGARLYGGYSVPQKPFRPNTTPCAGSSAHIRHHTPAAGNLGWSNAYPNAPVPPQRPCRPMTVHGANRFGQPQQRALCGPQQKVPNCWDRPHKKVEHPCERQQQCNGSDTSGTSDLSERKGQRGSTCVNITSDSPDPAPAVSRSQRCRRYINTSRDSKSSCLQGSRDPTRLQGGGSCKRHNCMGTQFAALLEDVTCQLRERRLAADLVKTT